MARLAVTIPDDLLKLARQASAKTDRSLSEVLELALRQFVSSAGVGSSKLVWPAPVSGKRTLTVKEICEAIDEGHE